ncbi:MAG TPA: vWA domain-containing protein [Thermoguttaceae bacterium]|nr:vWA domain-containing protein [Thermoguttaceae bacterium]
MFPPRRWLVVLSLTALLAGLAAVANEPEKSPAKGQAKEPPTVQLALLLDTSNSMDGLIDQAKTQLWRIVGQFAKTKLGGRTPRLEVALYEYGNDKLPAAEGYVRMVVPLTDEVDKISEALFALSTDGGEEYCGKVIQVATRQLDWRREGRDLRCIFIAGNEPFTQGDVDFRAACKAAADRGITVSTIYCGERDEGVRTNWEQGAKLADGSYLCINQDHEVSPIVAPQDNELARLSGELNKTYLAYGDAEARRAFADRQQAQDVNAARSAVSAAAARAGFKASSLYKNSGWDLVDAVADGTVKLDQLEAEQLPQVMQPKSLAERKAYLAKTAAQREHLQARIRKLSAVRDQYVAKERTRLAAEAPAEAAAAEEPLADAVEAAIQAQVGDK